MSGTTVEHNRRAVFHALARVFDDRMLMQQAYDLWEEAFSTTKIFRVNQYLDALKGHVGLQDAQRRQLAVAVYAALAQPQDKLNAVPTAVRKNEGQAPASAGVGASSAVMVKRGSSPAAVVFAQLICALADSTIKRGDAGIVGELREVLVETVSEHVTDASAVAAINAWSGADFSPESAPFEIADGARQSAVHALYLAVCDVHGPDQADRILSRAIAVTSELAEAEDYPPTRLL